jgi:hypothetical protein
MKRLAIASIEGLTDAQKLALMRIDAVDHLSYGEWSKHGV